MKSVRKSLALIIIFSIAITTISLLTIKPANAQTLSKPSIPQFTLAFDKHSSDRQATYATDPYTGQQRELEPAKHYEWETINVTITNQPFILQKNSLNASTETLFYNVRTKGHFDRVWSEFAPEDYFTQDCSGQYTVITFFVGVNGPDGDVGQGPTELAQMSLDTGGQVDFQIEALLGYVQFEGQSLTQTFGVQNNYSFNGTESGWSNTQTISVPANSNSPAPTPAIPEFSPVVSLLLIALISVAIPISLRKKALSRRL